MMLDMKLLNLSDKTSGFLKWIETDFLDDNSLESAIKEIRSTKILTYWFFRKEYVLIVGEINEQKISNQCFTLDIMY
jgi:hypothetical protein